MVVVDTSVLIDHLRTKESKESALLKAIRANPDEEFCISMISVQEMYEGTSTRNSEKEASLLATIGQLTIIPYNYVIAQRAGELARDSKRLVTFADCAIAATADVNDAKLLTLDEDFSDLCPETAIIKLK